MDLQIWVLYVAVMWCVPVIFDSKAEFLIETWTNWNIDLVHVKLSLLCDKILFKSELSKYDWVYIL